MTNPNSGRSPMAKFKLLTLGLGIAASLLANLGDRALSASPANSGIDPLQILDTSIKNNILFIVDTSGSMAGTPQNEGDIVGGDDPASRFYQTKRAVREVIALNAGKANFGVATFHPDFREHRIDGGQSLVYVTQDPTGNLYRGNFTTFSNPTPIAMTMTARSSVFSAVASSTYTATTNWTPATGSLLVAFVLGTHGSTPVDPTGVTGHGVAYSKVTLPSNTVSTTHAMSVWVAKPGAVPTNAAAAATFPSNRTAGSVVEYEVTGVDLSGGALAALASAVTSNAATGTAASTTLPAAADPANRSMYFVVHLANQATTPAGGWTEGTDGALATPATGIEIQSRPGSFSSPAGATWTTSSAWRGIAIELKAQDYSVCQGATCSATESSKIYSFFRSNDGGTSAAYPSGCTPQTTDQVAVGGAVNPPIVHELGSPVTSAQLTANPNANLGSDCRYYIKSKVMLNGKRYRVSRGAVAGSAITVSENITCPPPPPGLLGDDELAYANGTKNRACFQLQDVTGTPTNRITTYWLTGTNFDYLAVTPNSGAAADQCAQSGINVDVADCSNASAESQIQALMRMELQYDVNGNPLDVPPLTNLNSRQPNINDAPPFNMVPPIPAIAPAVVGPPIGDLVGPPVIPFTNPGIRQGNGTPLAASMNFALTYFRNTVLAHNSVDTGTGKRPWNAIGKQKQFVILLTDGNESCSGTPNTAAFNLWDNRLPTLPPCGADDNACLASRGVKKGAWDSANRIELLLITFAGGSAANVDAISRAGSGRDGSTCTSLYPTVAGSPLSPCRTAFIADNLTQLINQLNDAINQSTNTGEYSDQQSISESVYEFVNLAPLPAGVVGPLDPLNPENRYAATLPILFQSTFELPNFKGHLKAFRNNDNGTPNNPLDDVSVQVWDAGQRLYDRLSDPATGMNVVATSCTNSTSTGCRLFSALHAGATVTNIKSSAALIKRRIFTTRRNGTNSGYTASNLLTNTGTNGTLLTDPTLTALWPPSAAIAPPDNVTAGTFDAEFGLATAATVTDVRAVVPEVCTGSISGDIAAACTSATVSIQVGRAKREAREAILAFIAGAEIYKVSGIPVRDPSTKEFMYVARWSLSESTLAAPAVITTPGASLPRNLYKKDEYKLYTNGFKISSPNPALNGQPVEALDNGLGLTNPDLVTDAQASVINAAKANPTLKPSMSVVYHATNAGLHAFRAGPCPPPGSSGLFATAFDCNGEIGGEELWLFVPYDQLFKLPKLLFKYARGVDKVYMLTSPVRFMDIFVPTPGGTPISPTIGTPATQITPAVSGVWRTMLVFGRGQGGKAYTALDVTAPGAFTKGALSTNPPVVAWSRGNPDTSDGLIKSGSNVYNNTIADYNAYLKMGETWSVPASGFIGGAGPFPGPPAGPAVPRNDFPTSRNAVTDFVLFTGSGYSDTTTVPPAAPAATDQGKTFYALDPLTGDVMRSFDVGHGSPQAPVSGLTNFLVASPAVYTVDDTPVDPSDDRATSPTGFEYSGNPVDARARAVYFGDVHGRLFRYDPTTPATAPAVFFSSAVSAGNQPIAVGVSVAQDRASQSRNVYVYSETGRDRRVPIDGTKPFKMYGLRDGSGTATKIIEKNFDTGFRGVVQPASAFALQTTQTEYRPVVFFAGVRYSQGCVSQFDSVLVAVQGAVTAGGNGNFGTALAAFDLALDPTSDDTSVIVPRRIIDAIAVPRGRLQISTDEGVVPPPPSSSSATGIGTGGAGAVVVRTGLDPKSASFKLLMPTTVPYRTGSSVCRTDYTP